MQAESLADENAAFGQFLLAENQTEVDALTAILNSLVTPQINCQACGNCCKSLMINVSNDEANNLAEHLQQTRNEFDDRYIEKSESGRMLVNAIPCHFLENNSCTVYEHRFAGCREFPAMHLPQFTKRMFTTLMHYGRCPIVFHVVELAKINSGFVQ